MKRVLLLQWSESAYDSLRGILDLAGRELEADGCEVRRIVVDRPGSAQDLAGLLSRESFTFALGMSGFGAELLNADLPGLAPGTRPCSLWEAAKIPFFTWHCDNPAYYPFRHLVRNKYVVQGYVFPDHARIARDCIAGSPVTVAAHIGIPSRSLMARGSLPLAQRNGRLIFTKSGEDPEALRQSWGRLIPPVLQEVVRDSVADLWGRKIGDFTAVVGGHAESRGFFLKPGSILMLMLVQLCDAYLRARQATLVMESLMRFPVDVFGAGWGHLDFSRARAVLHGPVGFDETLAVLPDYLGSVSVNPLVDESVHDRVFFALGAGVVPIGDANAFTRREFPRIGDYAFDLDPDSVAAAADAALSHPARALEATEACHAAAADPFGMRESLRRIDTFCALQAGSVYG